MIGALHELEPPWEVRKYADGYLVSTTLADARFGDIPVYNLGAVNAAMLDYSQI